MSAVTAASSGVPLWPSFAPKPAHNVGADVPDYTGPKDGLSHPQHEWFTRPFNRALIAGWYRMRVEGAENLRGDGPQILAPTHPSYFDPPLISAISKRDTRFMANLYVFNGIRGKLMTWGGAFPVNREWASARTIKHCKEILAQGKVFCIFPEGTLADEHKEGRIGAIRRGAPYFAVTSKAEQITPIAIDYTKNDRIYPREIASGIAASLLIAGGCMFSATSGGPLAHVLASSFSAAIAGGYAGGRLMRDLTPQPDWADVFPRYFALMKGAAAGTLLGGLGGGLAAAYGGGAAATVTAVCGVAGALGMLGLTAGWHNRAVARVRIEKPIEVEPYRQKYPHARDAVRALQIDLHRAMGRGKQALTGVPYDDNAPKFMGRIVETLKATPTTAKTTTT